MKDTLAKDDAALVRETLAGRRESFGELVARHQERLYATLLRLVGDPEDAADLLQETFLRAYRKLDGFHGDSSFFTWIYRVAVNLALGERRRKRRERERFRIVANPETENPAETERLAPEPAAPPETADPAESIQREERDRAILAALDRLDPDHRAVLVLKDVEGHRYEEIAELLDIPLGTVRSRIHRARTQLRQYLRNIDADD